MVFEKVSPVVGIFFQSTPGIAMTVHDIAIAGGGEFGHEVPQQKSLIQQLLIPRLEGILMSVFIESVKHFAGLAEPLDIQTLNRLFGPLHRIEDAGVHDHAFIHAGSNLLRVP